MKDNSRTIHAQTILCLLWILLCFPFLYGCRSVGAAQEPSPPPPQESMTSLELPTPVIPTLIRGTATLPDALPLGFAVDVADIILGDDWNIEGSVLAFEEGTITFRTDQSEIGHFVYRLPNEIQISPLAPGQLISIQRNLRGNGPRLDYELQVASSEKLLIASSSVSGSEAQRITISPTISLRQGPEEKTIISESKYEVTYRVKVLLELDGTVMEVIVGQPIEFSINGENYLLLVTQSSEILPSKEYEGVVEGSGYILEYVFTLR